MVEARPEFTRLKIARKGYDVDQVDRFVDRVLTHLNSGPGATEISSHELAIEIFDEARGASAYDEAQVDTWRRDMRQRVSDLERSMHEEDVPRGDEGSALDMSAPPHYADRFPRVSRAVLGFTVGEVDAEMDRLRAAFHEGAAPSADEILSISFQEENGGYRQVAVAQTLELIALARRAS